MRSLFITLSKGGMISGMKAMCTGIRFWLITDMAKIPASISHLAPKAALALFSLPTAAVIFCANSSGSPLLATAMAKAPSKA